MEVGYCQLVTISTDNMLLTNEYRAEVGARWTFLSDPGRKVQKDLDIAEYSTPWFYSFVAAETRWRTLGS